MNTNLENLRRCSDLRRAVRSFFERHGYIEAVTDTRIAANAPEENIEAIRAEDGFLRTSPELALKNLLSLGAERIYEIGPCFRAEENGRRHRTEFTMLEYYSAGTGYRELAEFTAAMVAECAEKLLGGTKTVLNGEKFDFGQHEFITVEEAFRKYAGADAFQADAAGNFDELLVTGIEPELGRHKVTFLCDYPAAQAALSRLSPENPRVAERWELYIGGLELGNAFGELTDAEIQKERFRRAAEIRKARGMHEYPEPENFYAALDRGLPFSSGCAVGLDRLAMALYGIRDIGEVRF